ncbi:MAG: hypothetical protein OHK0029_26880 [Armatimonadaceae bacterium]
MTDSSADITHSASPPTTYDTIGTTYSQSRCAEPRIVETILSLLGLPTGSHLADIGAGTGNYTRALADRGFTLDAVEPSTVMREQAIPHTGVTWHSGSAEAIPLPDRAVQGVVSTLAIHHFPDLAAAFAEIARVSGTGPCVFFTFDSDGGESEWFWWLDYWPTLYDSAQTNPNYRRAPFPPLAEVGQLAESVAGWRSEIVPFPLPPDLSDHFMASGWSRPSLYLDPVMRAGTSPFALCDPQAVADGVERLRTDLESGAWEARYGAIRNRPTLDAGYRFLVLRPLDE